MDTCAAGMFCQRFHDGADLNNGTCTIEVECELCLQWFHLECVTFIPLEVKKQRSLLWLPYRRYLGGHDVSHYKFVFLSNFE